MDSIMHNNTWKLTDLPPGCKPLGCKWIFKRKMKVDGSIDKYKARLVIQGFRQKEGTDFFDTYAPVARISTIRLLIALASIHKLLIHQMDVKTAFLNGELDEEVYMKQPEGFVLPGQENKVCKLIKSLYGLKQAPKQWHQIFDDVILSHGFLLNQADKCVYSRFDPSGKGVIICLYVDDMLIFAIIKKDISTIADYALCQFGKGNIKTTHTLIDREVELRFLIKFDVGVVPLQWLGILLSLDCESTVGSVNSNTSNTTRKVINHCGKLPGQNKLMQKQIKMFA
ncbi:hypothetical protein E3N88_01716 [Mikania micrantha]|uniref:Reverse transcriptase Ty1/copia-type domain-containing protein n=1 Tax=Mikania micrantha TaxID=192012 RepID=A0A5N6Q4G6_9ASTR|nr:hypothetical protein E3N88_01716 [Mikania micrantha]